MNDTMLRNLTDAELVAQGEIADDPLSRALAQRLQQALDDVEAARTDTEVLDALCAHEGATHP